MHPVDAEVDRFLTLLRNKIRERGFTQVEVQAALGWGRSYISQLLTKQKTLRLEQVLLILEAIGAAPADFFAELYCGPWARRGVSHKAGRPAFPEPATARWPELEELRAELYGLVEVVIRKKIATGSEVGAAVRAAVQEDGAGIG